MPVKESRLGGAKTLKVEGFLNEFEKGDLKRIVNLVRLFEYFGIHPEKKGRSWMAKCPWHDDSVPSLSIDREKGLYNCFGCGESGDAFDLVKKMKGVDFKGALAFLKEYAGGNGSQNVLSSEPPTASGSPADPERMDLELPEILDEPQNPPALKDLSSLEDTTLRGVLKDVAGYYQKALGAGKEAVDYLKARGITNQNLFNRFSIGFSAGNLSDVISRDQKQELTRLGVFTDKGTEAFKGCVTFPLFDEGGRVTGFYGRKISDKSRVKHLYLKGPHKGLFNRKALSVYRDEIILTESIMDALSLIQLRVENVTCLYGTNGLTDELLGTLKAERVKLITLALDNDKAGVTAAQKLKDTFVAEGFEVKVFFPPEGKDWNEYLSSGGKKDEIVTGLESSEIIRPERNAPGLTVRKDKGKYLVAIGELSYRLLGVKEMFVSSLRLNIRAEKDGLSFIDNCDLYSARSRTGFSLHLSRLLDMESERIEKDLVRMVEYLEEERDKLLCAGEESEHELTDEEIELGMEFLTSPRLFDRIVEDTEALGYVGEEINKLLVYIAASSRKLDDPISVIVISESAAGKSYLIDTVKKLIPPEDVVSMTSLSDQALNYLPEEGLKHKFLVMGEAVHSEVVEHQIREMLSAHELSRLVTTKDEKTGQMSSRLIRKEVIVSAVMSSTNYDLNAENASRSFVVNTDESVDQTRRIHASQKKKYSTEMLGVRKKEIGRIIKTHHAAQRLLQKVFIVNPLADKIDFPDTLMRSRRDHDRFMDLIASVAFLRQYLKEEKDAEGVKYIECDLTDLEIASKIIKEILPATLTNFPKSAVTLYGELRKVITEKSKNEDLLPTEVSVTQRELREKTGLNQMFVKRNLKTLCDFEYLICTGSRRRGSRYSYRLVADEPIELLDLSRLHIPGHFQERESGSKRF